ncbi:MAG: HEAT repeat domain-containing protein, partial [Planctomycetota bacterium]
HIQARLERSIEELLNALENDSDDQVAGIVEELQAKGFRETHVELAMALARGSTTDRLSALETVAQDAAIQPIAWLVWVAESRDQAARMKAIAMLGSMADAEAIRHLQRIQQRESDPRIAAQIRQALVATQAASPKTR